MKQFSAVQDLADGLMALADCQDGKRSFLDPLLVSCVGLLSALSTYKKMSFMSGMVAVNLVNLSYYY